MNPYQSHINASVKASVADPVAAFRAAFLAIASIRVHSKLFWPQLSECYRAFTEGDSHPFLALGMKRRAIEALQFTTYELHGLIKASAHVELHESLCTVKGVGPAKAGFVVQMWTGEIGCIDSVNIQRLGLDPKEFSNMCKRKTGPKQYREFLPEPSPVLWERWCETVAERDGFSPVELSAWHSNFIQTGETE